MRAKAQNLNSCWQCCDNYNDSSQSWTIVMMKLDWGTRQSSSGGMVTQWLAVANPLHDSATHPLFMLLYALHQNLLLKALLLSFSFVAGHVHCQPLGRFEGRVPASLWEDTVSTLASHLFTPIFNPHLSSWPVNAICIGTQTRMLRLRFRTILVSSWFNPQKPGRRRLMIKGEQLGKI